MLHIQYLFEYIRANFAHIQGENIQNVQKSITIGTIMLKHKKVKKSASLNSLQCGSAFNEL